MTGVVVQVFERFEGVVCERWLGAVCRAALDEEGVGGRQVSLVIADDEVVRCLNGRYRGLDETTDVLSFGYESAGEYYGEGDAPSEWAGGDGFVLPPGECGALGEVIISYPQAVRQAEENCRSVGRELAHLITHGILHLVGHDHMGADEEAVMSERERVILAQIDGLGGESL